MRAKPMDTHPCIAPLHSTNTLPDASISHGRLAQKKVLPPSQPCKLHAPRPSRHHITSAPPSGLPASLPHPTCSSTPAPTYRACAAQHVTNTSYPSQALWHRRPSACARRHLCRHLLGWGCVEPHTPSSRGAAPHGMRTDDSRSVSEVVVLRACGRWAVPSACARSSRCSSCASRRRRRIRGAPRARRTVGCDAPARVGWCAAPRAAVSAAATAASGSPGARGSAAPAPWPPPHPRARRGRSRRACCRLARPPPPGASPSIPVAQPCLR